VRMERRCKEGMCISTDSLLSTEICTWTADENGQGEERVSYVGEVRWICFVEMYLLLAEPANTKT
jgi:hypothetical protein